MTAPYLTEAEAWREIAGHYAAGTNRYCGLCAAPLQLLREARIDEATNRVMCRRAQEHAAVSGRDGLYAFPHFDQKVRASAALFLALEAEDEAAERLTAQADAERAA